MYFFDSQVERWGDLKPVESYAGETDSKTAEHRCQMVESKKYQLLFFVDIRAAENEKRGKI